MVAVLSPSGTMEQRNNGMMEGLNIGKSTRAGRLEYWNTGMQEYWESRRENLL
jgi:hypothetical protein